MIVFIPRNILQKALDYLACTLDRGALELNERQKLRCNNCGTVYPVRDGIIYFFDIDDSSESSVTEIEMLDYIKNPVLNYDERRCFKAVNQLGTYFLKTKSNRKLAIESLMKCVASLVEDLNDSQSALLLQSATRTRYNLENYEGTFKIPRKIITELTSELYPQFDGIVVEGATGPGDCLLSLKEETDAPFYLGIDISERMTGLAQEKCSGKDYCLFVQGDIRSLPIRDSVASLYVVNNAWDRISQPRKSACEAARILRKNGYVIFSNCVPLQFEYERDGRIITYIPKEERITLEEAVELAGCELKVNETGYVWEVRTEYDGLEQLPMQIVGGIKKRQ